MRLCSPSGASGSERPGSRRAATARPSRAPRLQRDVVERRRALQRPEDSVRSRPRPGAHCRRRTGTPPGAPRRGGCGGEVDRLAMRSSARVRTALPQERRDAGDREAGLDRRAPIVDERLDCPGLLEPAFCPHPISATQRLHERGDALPSAAKKARASRSAARCGLRGMSAVTRSAATPPMTPSIKRTNGVVAGMIMTMSDWMRVRSPATPGAPASTAFLGYSAPSSPSASSARQRASMPSAKRTPQAAWSLRARPSRELLGRRGGLDQLEQRPHRQPGRMPFVTTSPAAAAASS